MVASLLPLTEWQAHLDEVGFQSLSILHVLWLGLVSLHERVQSKRVEKVLLHTLILGLLKSLGPTDAPSEDAG